MRRTFLALMAALALIVGGLGAASASAAVHNNGCTSGGTDISTTLNYTYPSAGGRRVASLQWSTNPNALLNRLELELRDDGALYSPAVAAGASSGTLNDVPSSGTLTENLPIQLSGGNYQYRVRVWGGVASSTATCNTGWDNF